MTEVTKRIIEEILKIPKGEVSCYRDVAFRAGVPNGARQVVRVLHTMTMKYELPWWRIVKVDGRIALSGDGMMEQIRLLRSEGVEVSDEGVVSG
jgi:methylated-DNA-protein-cysteine methyltransferase-like protein